MQARHDPPEIVRRGEGMSAKCAIGESPEKQLGPHTGHEQKGQTTAKLHQLGTDILWACDVC